MLSWFVLVLILGVFDGVRGGGGPTSPMPM